MFQTTKVALFLALIRSCTDLYAKGAYDGVAQRETCNFDMQRLTVFYDTQVWLKRVIRDKFKNKRRGTLLHVPKKRKMDTGEEVGQWPV